MASEELENLRVSHGLVNVPPARVLALELNKLPEKFAPARRQALITRDVSVEIARQMAEKGIPINFNLLESAHFARLIARHRGSGTTEGAGAVKEVKPTRVAEKILARGYNAPELAGMVAKWYSLGNPKVLKRLKAEDVAFLLGGYMTYGVQGKSGQWRYKVVHPREIPGLHGKKMDEELEATPTGKKREKEAFHAVHRAFLAQEYSTGVAPLVGWLEKQGISLAEVARLVNKRLEQGNYDVQERLVYGGK